MYFFGRTLLSWVKVLGLFFQRFDYPNTDGVGVTREGSDLDPVVSTRLGVYEGYFMKVLGGRTIYAFEGVPFAEPPERFKAPAKKKSFSGRFMATSYGPECIQTYYGSIIRRPPNEHAMILGSEDCLTCNIYSPMISNGTSFPKLPVILNFYGGGYTVGSSNDYGPAYLLQRDVVLISCNYRIGVYGFLSTGDANASGNWGLKDAALALDWVYENVLHFGGDPNKIILFGQSAGATIAHLLILSTVDNPERGKKILAGFCASGSALHDTMADDPSLSKRLTWRFAVINFCPTNQGSEKVLECLRRRDPRRLILIQNLLHLTEGSMYQFHPIVEPNVPGAILIDTPRNIYLKNKGNGKFPKIPILFSSTSRDVDLLFVLTKAIRRPYTLVMATIVGMLPNILDYRLRSEGREKEITRRIVDFYGGIEKMKQNPEILFQLVNDRYFHVGLHTAMEAHARVAPTYGLIFGHKSSRGFAGRFELNVTEFEVAHTEDLFYMFNRTDVQPVNLWDDAYWVVQFYQDVFESLGTSRSLRIPITNSTTGSIQLATVEPIQDASDQFKMIVVGTHDVQLVDKNLSDEVTEFWNNLGIKRVYKFRSR